MRRILSRHILSNWVKMLFWLLLAMLMLLIIGLFLFRDSIGSFGEQPSGAEYWSSIYFIILIGQLRGNQLPDAYFIMPLSGKDRERIVRILFYADWIGMSFIAAGIINLRSFCYFLHSGNNGSMVAFQFLFFGIGILLSAYPVCYFKFFEAIESMHVVTIMVLEIVESVIFSIVADVLSVGTKYALICIIVFLIAVAIDVWFHKRYFGEMVQFYSGYESSRRLKENKVSV